MWAPKSTPSSPEYPPLDAPSAAISALREILHRDGMRSPLRPRLFQPSLEDTFHQTHVVRETKQQASQLSNGSTNPIYNDEIVSREPFLDGSYELEAEEERVRVLGILETSLRSARPSREPVHSPKSTFNKGGRPPKEWPSSGRRLLVRFATAARQKFTFIERALEENGLTVSTRHVQGKIRELFGSRKVGDDGYDAKLRPKDANEMDQRIKAFVDCEEQWYMLKKRATMLCEASPAQPSLLAPYLPYANNYPPPNVMDGLDLGWLPHFSSSNAFPSVDFPNFDFTGMEDLMTDGHIGEEPVTNQLHTPQQAFPREDFTGSTLASPAVMKASFSQPTEPVHTPSPFAMAAPDALLLLGDLDGGRPSLYPGGPAPSPRNHLPMEPSRGGSSVSSPAELEQDWRLRQIEQRRARNRESKRASRERQRQSKYGPLPNLRLRVRSSKACRSCRERKVRCTGEKSPCDRCVARGCLCVYDEIVVSKRRNYSNSSRSLGHSPYTSSNHSNMSSNSSIRLDGLSLGASSQESIVSSYSPSPTQEAPPFVMLQERPKESAIKRFLRSRFYPETLSNISATSFSNAEKDLSKAGVRSSDHLNLYRICFALSASSARGLSEPALLPSLAIPAHGVTCEQCHVVTCVQEECQHDLSPEWTIDHKFQIDAQGNSNLHRAVQHGRKIYVTKLLDFGVNPWAKNNEGMNPAVYGWGFLLQHKEDVQKYANIWVCMLRVLEKQRMMPEDT